MAKKKPTKPGFYWAKWIKATEWTHEGDQLTPEDDWGIVHVTENFIGEPCEADQDEKFLVMVPGVRESQWVDNFVWGDGPIEMGKPAREIELEKDVAGWTQLAKYQRGWFEKNRSEGKDCGPCPTDAAILKSEKLLGREIGYPAI